MSIKTVNPYTEDEIKSYNLFTKEELLNAIKIVNYKKKKDY